MKFSFTAVVALLGTALAAPLDGRAENEQSLLPFNGPGVYTLESVATNTVIDLAGSSRADGTSIIGWQSHGGNNQKWQVAAAGNNEYLFLNVAAGTYLTANERPTNGLTLITGNLITPASKRARWTIRPAGLSGAYTIANAADARKVLDLKGSGRANGTPVILYQAHGGKNQQWRFKQA